MDNILSKILQLVVSFLRFLRQLVVSFLQFLRSSKKSVLLVLSVATVTLLISTTISLLLTRIYNLYIPTLSNIRTQGVEAYWNNNTQNEIAEINWGNLWLGSSKNVTIYLLSISTVSTTLKLARENLIFYNTNRTAMEPPDYISTYMHLNWDYDGSIMESGDVIGVTLTLQVAYSRDYVFFLIENDIESFSLEILIHTVEYIA